MPIFAVHSHRVLTIGNAPTFLIYQYEPSEPLFSHCGTKLGIFYASAALLFASTYWDSLNNRACPPSILI